MLGLRKSKRYKAKNDVYIRLENSMRKFQIDDISQHGVSFFYAENGRAVGKGSRTLTIHAGNSHSVEGIRFSVASDTYAGESTLPNSRIKRLSLHFEGLSFNQKSRLKNLIHHHNNGMI